MGPATEVSGGSAANTTVGVASFGGRAAFIGRVADDTFGKVFRHDLRSAGVHFAATVAADGSPTGRCLVIVTPDAERTMCTFLGAGQQLDPSDVDDAIVATSRSLYLEGYLWDEPVGEGRDPARGRRRAPGRAPGRAHALRLRSASSATAPSSSSSSPGTSTSSSPTRTRSRSLYEVDDFDEAVAPRRGALRDRGAHAVGARARSSSPAASVHVDRRAIPVDASSTRPARATSTRPGSSTAHARAAARRRAGSSASLAAAEVISHLGARPEQSLARRWPARCSAR